MLRYCADIHLGPVRAILWSTASPRRSVASSTAYEMRKWVSRREKTLPGMISRLLLDRLGHELGAGAPRGAGKA